MAMSAEFLFKVIGSHVRGRGNLKIPCPRHVRGRNRWFFEILTFPSAVLGSQDFSPYRAGPAGGSSNLRVMAEATKAFCNWCLRAERDGRCHGLKFLCTECESVDRLVRRNLGSLPSLEEEDRCAFFQRAVAVKDGPKHTWKLVKAALVQQYTLTKLRKSGVKLEAPWKPLTFWLQQGYPKEKIEQCPCRDDERYGWLYKVETLTEVDKRFQQEAEEEILQREANCVKKRKAGKEKLSDEPEWQVPEAEAAAVLGRGSKPAETGGQKTAKQEAKEKAKEALAVERREKANALRSAFAGKTLSQLQPRLEGLKNATKLCCGNPDLKDLGEEVEEATKKIVEWIQKSRDFVAAHALCPSGILEELPYDVSTLKATVKASGQVIAAVKEKHAEQKSEKPKAKAKAKASTQQAKRRRTGEAEAAPGPEK